MHVAGATPLPGRSTRSCVHVRSADFCPGDTDAKKKNEEERRSTHFYLKRTAQMEKWIDPTCSGTIVHSLTSITGPWKLKSCSKSSFGAKSAGIKKQKLGSVILTRFVSLIYAGNFWREHDAILAPLFFAPFGRDSVRLAREMSLVCHSRTWQKAGQNFDTLCDNA